MDQLAAPVNALADAYHVSYLQAPISLGAMISFFALSLSCVNAGARIFYPMARHGALHHAMGNSHHRNKTPHIAITVYTIIVFAIPTIMQAFTDPLTTFGDAGTLAAFGFLTAYYLISVAAPMYLRRRDELTRKNIADHGRRAAVSAGSDDRQLLPAAPSAGPILPVLLPGLPAGRRAWLAILHRRDRTVISAMEADLEATVDIHDHPTADSTAESSVAQA